MESLNKAWASVQQYCLQAINNPVVYNVWISIISPVSIDGKKAVLRVPSGFQKDIVENNYISILSEAFLATLGLSLSIEIIADGEDDSDGTDNKPISETFTFENFIVGDGNKLAHAASMAVAEKPALIYNPLFIYSGPGLGKTHLLHAIRNQIRKTMPHLLVTYVKGDDFTNDFIESVRQGEMRTFHNKYRDCDVFLVDDIQFIAGKVQTQEEFFHTFNTLYENKKQIILTSDRPPNEIATLDERLRTRFHHGLMADISVPNVDTRIAIVRQKAEEMNFELSNDVSTYIAQELKNDIRQLEGAIQKLKAHVNLDGEKPSIPLVQSIIRDVRNFNQPTPITVEKIILEVARTFQVTPEDLRGGKQSQAVSIARQAAMYIIQDITQMSLTLIGDEFNNRDHSTVHYAINKAEDHMKTNDNYKATVSDIIKNIKNQ